MSSEKDLVLSRIRESEKKAEELLSAARAQADEITASAKKESLRILRSSEAAIGAREAQKLAAIEKEMRNNRESLVLEGKKSAGGLRQSAEKNIDRTVDWLFERFIGEF